MKKIIVYTNSPLNKTYAKKILLDQISEKYHMELWTKFKKNNIYFKNSKEYSFNVSKYFLVKNNFDLFFKLKNIKDDKPIIIYVDYNASLDVIFLFFLKILRIKFIVPPRRTSFKFDKSERNIFKNILKKDKFELFDLFLKFVRLFFFTILNKTNIIKRPNIIFVCGDAGYNSWLNYYPKRLITVNSVDLSYEISNFQFQRDYAVYIDESKLYSPDLSLSKVKNPSTVVDPNSFYENLRSFFDKVEKKFSLEVIISCSNKYDYKKYNPFGDRTIFYGQTNNIIKNSKIVLCHHSSGFWQAIYDKKKILFLTDANLEIFNQNLKIKNNAKFLNTTSIDLLDDINSIDLNVNDIKYEDIIFNYFISHQNLKYDSVIFNVLKNLY